MNAKEYNFDGLVGPTHCYAGLSYGNIASMSHRAAIANPREAALQGLTKAKALADLGLGQGIVAPQSRPDLKALRRLGFGGSDTQVLAAAARAAPELLAACASASSMWTANAATVAPSADTGDGKVHFTSANLCEKFHRSLEHETTARILAAMFKGDHFVHHAALPSANTLGDEGAANHTRFCADYGAPGLQLFIYGRVALDAGQTAAPVKFPARQTREASEAVARLHLLAPERTVLAQQTPESIDGGAFHNDVISVGNQNLFLYHETALVDSTTVIADLKTRFEKLTGHEFFAVCVPAAEVSLADAVKSYLFNSQLVTLPAGAVTLSAAPMALIAPQESRDNPAVAAFLQKLIAGGKTPLREIHYFDLKQSMRNGGGPACLRLRVVLNEAEVAAVNPQVLLHHLNHARLSAWVHKHYRDRLQFADLADPALWRESRTALDELTQMLALGSVYDFQRSP